MAYVVARPGGRYELREAASTKRGPRSRTLASFRELTSDVVEHARTRANTPLSDREVRRAAARAGAPIALARPDAAAAALLAELGRGRRPTPRIARVLAAELAATEAQDSPPPSHEERAAAAWLAATPAARGKTLEDLLLLTDSLPASRPGDLTFPVIHTTRS
jgi:hypothetical protein